MRSTVEVLLREHVDSLGRCGDVVRVSAGYARNYLLPRRIAVQANEENKRVMVRRRARLDAEDAVRAETLAAAVEALGQLVLRSVHRADDHGQLYGSVSAAAVAGLLVEAGHPVAERDVRLDAPIRKVGTHVVRVHLHGDRYAEVTVEVSAEDGAA